MIGAHGRSLPQRSQQCVAGLLVRNRISDEEGNGLMQRGVGHQNFYLLNESQQRRLLPHVCMVREYSISPVESAHFYAATKLTKARLYPIT
ncbi:hypothetical protein EVAR_10133_1 [Eumeta japonica]|uniref:Uncharacterized protein n=1 Tax=Eumeta variegata TaxID=151549 RepID=A0A4C1UDI6_EUMVA|nr:hypothetical protein EVAR_10133_1 [Eumeta japonica]